MTGVAEVHVMEDLLAEAAEPCCCYCYCYLFFFVFVFVNVIVFIAVIVIATSPKHCHQTYMITKFHGYFLTEGGRDVPLCRLPIMARRRRGR